jgi:hypothetical protein
MATGDSSPGKTTLTVEIALYLAWRGSVAFSLRMRAFSRVSGCNGPPTRATWSTLWAIYARKFDHVIGARGHCYERRSNRLGFDVEQAMTRL